MTLSSLGWQPLPQPGMPGHRRARAPCRRGVGAARRAGQPELSLVQGDHAARRCLARGGDARIGGLHRKAQPRRLYIYIYKPPIYVYIYLSIYLPRSNISVLSVYLSIYIYI